MITGLVLAAGSGRRLGQPKAEVVIGGMRLIDRVAGILLEGGCDDVAAVLRESVRAPAGVRAVVNRHPDRGMGSSLRCGLAESTADACLIALVDQPGLSPVDVAAVLAAYRAGAPVVAARRAGRRSHPVLISRQFYAEVAESAVGDRGAREFLDRRPDIVRWLDLDAELADIDTPADLDRVRAGY